MNSATTTACAALLEEALGALTRYEAERSAEIPINPATQGFDLAVQILADVQRTLHRAPVQSIDLAPDAIAQIKLQMVKDRMCGRTSPPPKKSIELF
ncbi:hypothetical protein [Donghicola sp. XS_ASV15]|uniref:hypothetical protein n=1 Tax=Donghicola sp. XS_ASV15 TaxID=3241295 RepID=UPI003512C727